MRSENSDRAYNEFCATHRHAHAQQRAYRAALTIIDHDTNDRRVTRPEVEHLLGDTRSAVGRRIAENLCPDGYLVEAGVKYSVFLREVDHRLVFEGVGSVAEAWTLPELYDSLPVEHRRPHEHYGAAEPTKELLKDLLKLQRMAHSMDKADIIKELNRMSDVVLTARKTDAPIQMSIF